MRSHSLVALVIVILLGISPLKGGPPPGTPATATPPRTLSGQTPDVVVHGTATLHGHHAPGAVLTLHIGLGVHNSPQLDAIIAAASNPASPQYGRYLTRAQYRAQFAPTDQEVQAVQGWAAGAGLTVKGVSPDNLLITVSGTTSQVEHALGVTVNDYSLSGRTFFSNDRDAVVPGNLDIRAISGLSTAYQVHTTLDYAYNIQSCPTGESSSISCYDPWDFISAYNTAHVGSGIGQNIGFTLWGAPVQQSDLLAFSQQTNTPEIISGQAGDNGIDWLQVGNSSNYGTNDLNETAMDVEYAHGVAPNSHLRYYLADCTDNPNTGHCEASNVSLETAVDDAANDASLHVVSNSWLGTEADSTDPFVSNINAALQYAASVGTTFYFSSGDQGSNSGGTGLPSFPADSPYVVAVGGTTLHTDANSDWSSETAWSGSGGGCSTIVVRPWWQAGVDAATCAGRATPDVAADADPNTGAFVAYGNGRVFLGNGTSLAAPLWAGMAADINRYLAANGRTLMGFAAPAIYQLANNTATYSRDFHDVQSGNNGYPAGSGWDEATGWGSPNLTNLAADWPSTVNAPPTGAILTLPTATSADGCKDNTLPANDDGSTNIVPLPFTANFFGQSYGALYVNNNGNVTFDSPLGTYTPFPLTDTSHVIIAPFFGDVDTRSAGSDTVTYGATTYAGQPAFCVDWVNVGYFGEHTDKLNSFQLVLISRPDRNPGDFDIMFNYNQIQWETGDASGGDRGFGGSSARVGYSNGTDTSFELPGSAVNGAFLDWNAATGLVNNNRNSTQPGRYLFTVQNGIAPTGGSISGGVFANSDTPINALGGAFVQVCSSGGFCQTTSTNASGQYTVNGLPDGQYTVTAFPPGTSSLLQGSIGPLTLSGNPSLIGQDIVLSGPTPPPPGTTITSVGTGDGGLPVVYWNAPLTLTTQGCAGGTASYQILQDGSVIRSGGMTEGPAGTYTAAIAPLYPSHGNAHVSMTINCPDASTTTIPFDIYIDPSGTVQTVEGAPISGATVTLYRSDSSSGPFEPVPNGDGIMSLANRNNPDTTDAAGHFGWDVVAGFYKVRAAKDGCVSPDDPSQAYVESPVLTVPPAVTGLVLTLNCDNTSATATPTNTPTDTPTTTPTNTPTPAATVTPSARFVITPSSASYGQTFTMTGTNFGPDELVNIYGGSVANPPIYSTTTDDSGAFTFVGNVRQGPGGLASVIAVGQSSGRWATAPFYVKSSVYLQHGAGTAGSQNVLTGLNFGSNETVTAYWTPGNIPLGQGTTNGAGSLLGGSALTFTVPLSATGTYHIVGIGQNSRQVAITAFTIAAPPTNTPTPTDTPTNTPTNTPTDTPTNTPTPTLSPTPTNTPTNTPVPPARLALSPASVYFGQTLTLTGTNFGAGETVSLYVDSTNGAPLYTATTSGTGTFVRPIVQGQYPYGPHTFIAVGQSSRRAAAAPYAIKAATFLAHTSGAAGSSDTLNGLNFGSYENVRVYWLPGTIPLGTTAANLLGTAVGSQALTFTVPLSPTGTYTVVAVGQATHAVAGNSFTITSSSVAATTRSSASVIAALPRRVATRDRWVWERTIAPWRW